MSRGFNLFPLRSLLLTVAALCVTSHAAAQTPVRIMPLGDSITAGPGCWRAYLWNQLQTAGYSNIDFVGGVNNGDGCGLAHDTDHEGHSGFSITGIADQNQLPPWLTAARPDIIVVHLGTNDMWGGHIPLANKITALTKLIGQMRANNPNVKIVMAQIIPMNAAGCTTCMSDVVAFNNAIVPLAASLNSAQSPIFIVDQWTGFNVVTDTFDQVHPVTSGFIKMANKFFPVVAQALNTGAPVTSTLSVAKAGAGSGTVTSTPAGINCGTTCSGNFITGSSVTLTAAAATGSTFAGWSGACTGTGTCTVTMAGARAVTATFGTSANTFALSVTRAGAGTGAVTSNPAGISCGSTCSASYANNTSVTLTALPASNSTFGGWSGACTGTGTCTVSMTQARSVTATFNAASLISLSVVKAGTGSGTVTSSPSGINCGAACVAGFGGNAVVTLTASPASGSVFAGWSGSCTGVGSCVLTMNQARSVTATFNTSGGTGGTCANPVSFTNNTGNFNTTGAVCYRTNMNINGWGCSNFDGRTLTVGGVARTCGQLPLTRASDGYYYFSVTAGQFPWASMYAW
ncbi:MAG TPA: GDSL-type esterase/lipase family protein [Steroidobacteraceae bacterium]|nr:GDSL-type esterase/lipase family protein [Steroidobacteraceae bacterium]